MCLMQCHSELFIAGRRLMVKSRNPLLGLTIYTPWAQFVFGRKHLPAIAVWPQALPPKRLENREHARPWHWAVGRHIAIHSAKTSDSKIARRYFNEGIHFFWEVAGQALPDDGWPRGKILGIAKLAAVVDQHTARQHCSEDQVDFWMGDHIAYHLTDVVAIDPVDCRGGQGLWTVPNDVLPCVRSRYQKARKEVGND